ncbi:ankyrin repeat domain-containing protein 60 [Protopterus annectens]|uniref:ankyrin repeat domain-containing protein 60 n=1 Tax=Protopterus annectens TaxID=7888 RepID=UPI001CFB4078|nr:ankyrin repeat domain-containing protein 60 [Protopterus annectens]
MSVSVISEDSPRSEKSKFVHHSYNPRHRTFPLTVKLEDTEEMFTVPGCYNTLKIRELKEILELRAGIPSNFQRLLYLDEGDLHDDSTLQFNDIVPGGRITLRIWHQDGWRDLVKAAVQGDITQLLSLGITKDSRYTTPNSKHMNAEQKQAWIAHRAFVSLYIAAHRGNFEAVRFLLKHGASVSAKTPVGRTALHAAAAMGSANCIDELLSHGSQIHQPDNKKQNALDLAGLFGRKKSERRLFLFQWRQRAAGVKIKSHLDESELFAHQKFDSKLKPWHTGSHAKLYMANLQKPGEFQGTAINAPRNPSVKHYGLERIESQSSVSTKPLKKVCV